MDSYQLFQYDVTGFDISDEFPHMTTSAISEWMVEPLNYNLDDSPYMPLASHFDCDTFNSLRSSQTQYSSTENLSVVSPSHSSSIETNNSSHCISPSSVHLPENQELCSGGSFHSDNANCGEFVEHFPQEVETVLMGSEADECKATSSNLAFKGNKRPQISSKRSRPQSQKRRHESNVNPPQPCLASENWKTSQGTHADKRHGEMETFSQKLGQSDLKQLLIQCAKYLSENMIDDFNKLIQEANRAVSITGEPIQRLGAYMVEGLVARKEASGTKIYRSLRCRETESKDFLSCMRILYEICPFFKFGYMAANGVIAEAFRDEDQVHIIDFQIARGTQWVTLIEALASRPSGPPHVRITGIDDPVSNYARGDSLEAVGKRLAAISEKFNIPVEFNAVPVFGPEVTPEMLDVRPGEALAVNFTLQLHHMPDESVDLNNPRDALLRMVRSFSPKVITLVEQESNTNTTPFLLRFIETLDYYSAMFESIATLPMDGKERINMEQHHLARDIVNIIACEEEERVERHELLGKWKSRLTMAEFQPYPLSSYINSIISRLLKYYSEHYTLVEKDGAMLLGWKGRHLVSVSAWH